MNDELTRLSLTYRTFLEYAARCQNSASQRTADTDEARLNRWTLWAAACSGLLFLAAVVLA